MSSNLVKKMGSKMLILSEMDVRHCLSMADCLNINRTAYMSISNKAWSKVHGKGQVPTRLGLPGPATAATTAAEAQDWTLFKPAAFYAQPNSEATTQMGMKLVSIRSNNAQQGLPLVPATVLALNAETGIVEAVVSSTYLTGARTAAGSGLSTQLARSSVQRVVIFGAGLQAECHVDAIETAMNQHIPYITLINRTAERAEALKQRILSSRQTTAMTTTDIDVVLLSDKPAIGAALSQADVVVATTNTTTPLFDDGSILPSGCHIISIGSYTPDMQEIPVSAVNRCRILTDTPDAVSVGDLRHLNLPKPQPGDGTNNTLLGDALGDDTGKTWCQQSADNYPHLDCTFYKGVGTAIQDVMTASLVVQRARELGIGTEVDMS